MEGVPENVNIMALTTTATRLLQKSIDDILGMRDAIIVTVPPCKANLMYGVGLFKTIKETFSPVLESLCKERHQMPRMIVYCRTYNQCADLFLYFKSSLGGEFIKPPFESELNKYALVNMFLGFTPAEVKAEIVRPFATSSFGIGVDCCDVQQVIHVDITDDRVIYPRNWQSWL